MVKETKYAADVQARIAKEQAEMAVDPAEVPGVNISSEFVMECLVANEFGDGMLYAALHQDEFIYVKNFQKWFVWCGHYWQEDKLDYAVGAVEKVALRYIEEIEILGSSLAQAMALGEEGEDRQKSIRRQMKRIYQRIEKLRSDAGRRNCLKFAHTNYVNQLAITGDDFDKDPWLFACKNGVIDLKKGTLRAGKQKDYISKCSPVEWQGIDAPAKAWDKALDEIFEGNKEMIDFNRRFYGYGITGVVTEHVFSVHHGGGRNGKGLMFDMFMRAMGTYAGPIPSEMLLDSNKGGASANQTDPALLAMKGLRLAIASETDEGRKFSAAKVKWYTGGDVLTARGLYDKSPTSWDPTHLLALLTNNKPDAPGTDFAFWSRCNLIHQRIKFLKDKPPMLPNERKADPELYNSLREDLPGILAWLVRGCLEWQKDGLKPPEIVTSATEEYQEDENYIGQFIKAAIEIDEKYSVSAKKLYQAFEIFYLENFTKVERFVPSKTKFGKRLMATELFKKKRPGGIIKYYGLQLNPVWESRRNNESGDKT